MSDPAPPPCEACKTYLRSEPSHIALNEWLKMFDEHHRIIAEKDAEIAELRARIEGLAKEWDVGSWNVDENARDAARRLRAALAPKVSHD